MKKQEVVKVLSRLVGQDPADDRVPDNLYLFSQGVSRLGYSQLNELLMMLGFDRVSHAFFAYLVDDVIEYRPGMGFKDAEHLEESVTRFEKFGILLYGNVKFAFKRLSSNDEELLDQWSNLKPIPAELFLKRHEPIMTIEKLMPKDAFLTGYIVEKDIL